MEQDLLLEAMAMIILNDHPLKDDRYMYQFKLYFMLFIFCFQSGCTAFRRSIQNKDDSSNVKGMNSQSPLPPLAIKIREKALELRLKDVELRLEEDKPRELKTLPGSEGGKLPQYVKDLILNEVKNQSWSPLPPQNRPCYVDPKRKQPQDIFYALQRAAFGTTKASLSNTPDPDQGVKLSPFWSGIKWSEFVGYHLETYRLLDQLEEWFSELNTESFDTAAVQSLGLTTVQVPDITKKYVRRTLVLNDLDLVVNNRGRDRDKLRCFLAHQVKSNAADNIPELTRYMAAFNHFENITDINFGLLKRQEDLDVLNNILTEKKGVKGIYFDIEWEDNGPHTGVAFDPMLIGSKIVKENRERLTRFYARYGVWEYLNPSDMFSLFPNITQLSFRIDTDSDWREGDAKKVAAFLDYTRNTKVNEMALSRFNYSDSILKFIVRPMTHIKKVDIQSDSNTPIDLSEVARVFPQAKTVTFKGALVSLSREKLDALQRQNVKVGWEKVFLKSCNPETRAPLVFNHPTFTETNLQVFRIGCSESLSIEKAPTFDEIKNQLVHRLAGEKDQSNVRCSPGVRQLK